MVTMLDEFGFEESAPDPRETAGPLRTRPIREDFPPPGDDGLGGLSDGWEYRTVFQSASLSKAYDLLRQFLQQEGYGDVPIPANTAELRRFQRPRRPQPELFEERGYVHNPIKILFPADARRRNTLILCLYNERAEGHLLRFHGLWP
ncbi:MAG: hypothetical protein ACK4NS_01155 [Saprospiraceae bacterium]